jgi:hypothetical protein
VIIVTLCDDDDRTKENVLYSIPTNFKTLNLVIGVLILFIIMRWKCVFKFFFSRQQTDSRQQTSADRGPKKSIIVVLSLHVQCCTY